LLRGATPRRNRSVDRYLRGKIVSRQALARMGASRDGIFAIM
jgi:hypothetical protein